VGWSIMQSEKTGKNFENQVECIIQNCGYDFVQNEIMVKMFINGTLQPYPKKIYTRNYPMGYCLFPNIKKREEFLIYDPILYPHGCVITAKWQQSSGTGYEKERYLLENILHYYNFPTIVVFDGAFEKTTLWKKVQGVIDAYFDLKKYVDGKKLLGVYRYNEFTIFANGGGL